MPYAFYNQIWIQFISIVSQSYQTRKSLCICECETGIKKAEISTFFKQLLFLCICIIGGSMIIIIAYRHGNGTTKYEYIILIEYVSWIMEVAYNHNSKQEINQNEFFLYTTIIIMINFFLLYLIYQSVSSYLFMSFLCMYYMCCI